MIIHSILALFLAIISAVTPPPTTIPLGNDFYATRYGDGRMRSDGSFEPNYNGLTMGCGGAYWSSDSTIVAVSYALSPEVPCGTRLIITSAYGRLEGIRTDTCPGCKYKHIDLSEAGLLQLCGGVECGPIYNLKVEIVK